MAIGFAMQGLTKPLKVLLNKPLVHVLIILFFSNALQFPATIPNSTTLCNVTDVMSPIVNSLPHGKLKVGTTKPHVQMCAILEP